MRLWAIGAVVGAGALAAGYFALRPTGGAANDAPYRTAAIDRQLSTVGDYLKILIEGEMKGGGR